MRPSHQKIIKALKKRKAKGITGAMFPSGFNYNTRISELRFMGYQIKGQRTSKENPLFTHWLISEPQ